MFCPCPFISPPAGIKSVDRKRVQLTCVRLSCLALAFQVLAPSSLKKGTPRGRQEVTEACAWVLSLFLGAFSSKLLACAPKTFFATWGQDRTEIHTFYSSGVAKSEVLSQLRRSRDDGNLCLDIPPSWTWRLQLTPCWKQKCGSNPGANLMCGRFMSHLCLRRQHAALQKTLAARVVKR